MLISYSTFIENAFKKSFQKTCCSPIISSTYIGHFFTESGMSDLEWLYRYDSDPEQFNPYPQHGVRYLLEEHVLVSFRTNRHFNLTSYYYWFVCQGWNGLNFDRFPRISLRQVLWRSVVGIPIQNRNRIRISRIRMFLSLLDPDPDPLVIGTDPAAAPDPSLFS
jgi:hypothetical protein